MENVSENGEQNNDFEGKSSQLFLTLNLDDTSIILGIK